MRRQRRSTPPGEFSDPLSNYNPPQYEDDLERSIMEDDLEAMQCRPFETIRPSTPVEQAVRRMGELDVACLMVSEADGKLVGILSERDVLNKVADNWEATRQRPVSEVMTPSPVVAYQTDNPAKALNLMAIGGFRHVPVLDVDDRVVGILGPRRVTAYLKNHLNG